MRNKPIHFLLVEADDDHAELITLTLLATDGVPKTVDRVCDGEQALTYLKRDIPHGQHPRPNVVLLDLNLPGVNGHSVLATIKADPELRNIPVVVLTTSQEPEDKVKAYSSYANSYLVKPTDSGEFSRMVKDVAVYWSVWNQQLD